MKKVLVIVIALVVIGFFGYRLYNEKRDNQIVTETQFHTYSNPAVSFSIDVPTTWLTTETNPGVDPKEYKAVIFVSPQWIDAEKKHVAELAGKPGETLLPNIAVNYYQGVSTLLGFENNRVLENPTLENYLKTSQLMKDVRKTTLAGIDGWHATVSGLEDIDTIFMEHDGHIYAIGVSNRIGFPSALELAMENSFKFIDANKH